MKLHENKEAFEAAVSGAADYYEIAEALIEKDVYKNDYEEELLTKHVFYGSKISAIETCLKSEIFL